ncbi:MAG TPA: hypothetical protein VF855_15215 [Acidimicrobiales bacterium]
MLIWLSLLAVAAAGVWWGLNRTAGEPEPDVGTAEVRGGLLRIDAVGAEEATDLPMAMPGMTHDPISEDHYLLRVDATLGATDGSIRYQPADFRVRGPGMAAAAPYRAVAGPGMVFEGMSAPLLLVFEVPKGVSPLTLEYGGGRLAIDAVTPPSGDTHNP